MLTSIDDAGRAEHSQYLYWLMVDHQKSFNLGKDNTEHSSRTDILWPDNNDHTEGCTCTKLLCMLMIVVKYLHLYVVR